MRKLIVIIGLFLSLCAYGQFLPGVKHIEIISELQDSMVLLNKPDVDKINKTYFEKSKLDSLNVYKDEKINLLESKILIQDSIITNVNSLLKNEIAISIHLQDKLDNKITQYEKQLRKEKAKKVCWQTATGVAIVGIILTLCLK